MNKVNSKSINELDLISTFFFENKHLYNQHEYFENSKFKTPAKLLSQEESDNTVSIVGLNNVFQKDLHLTRRLLWLSALMVCCSLVGYYVTSRLQFMQSLPTQVTLILKQNDTLVLPDVTICPSPMFIGSKMASVGMLQDGSIESNSTQAKVFNATKLWETAAPTLDFIAVSVVNMEHSRQNWKIRFTTLGVCFTHHYDGKIQASGLKFGMQIKLRWTELNSAVGSNKGTKVLDTQPGLKIFFHPYKDEPLTEIEGIFVSPGQDVSIAIRLKEFQSLNRTGHPCIYSNTYEEIDLNPNDDSRRQSRREYSKSHCVNRCFNSALYSKIKCNLPFMIDSYSDLSGLNNNTETESNPGTDTDCNSVAKYNSAFQKFWLEERLNVTMWAECGQGCLIECSKFEYTPFVESVAPSKPNFQIGALTIYFPEMSYEIVTEKEAYGLISLLCDVGGFFGLFLGCSILTFVEIVEFVLVYFKNMLLGLRGRGNMN